MSGAGFLYRKNRIKILLFLAMLRFYGIFCTILYMPIAEKTDVKEPVTLARSEYEDLLDKKMRFEFLRYAFEEDIFSPPPTRNVNEIVDSFKETGKYSKKFIDSLEHGLKRSSYFAA